MKLDFDTPDFEPKNFQTTNAWINHLIREYEKVELQSI